MGRMKQLGRDERNELRRRLYEDLDAGSLSIPETVRRMRAVTGLTQREFAERVAEISLPALQRIEQGRGNPRLDTLEKVGRHFGVEVRFVRPTPDESSDPASR